MDLVITNAVLPSSTGYWDIGIVAGRIAHISPAKGFSVAYSLGSSTALGSPLGQNSRSNTPSGSPSANAAKDVLDAQGRLVIPGLADAHFHLDKVSLLKRCIPDRGDFREAMEKTLAAKRAFTLQDIQTRASHHIEQAIAFGTSFMRSHVEVDPTIRLRAIEALLPLRDRYAWGLDLQLAVFAQEGITHDPEIPQLLRQAMTLGGDLIGSAPYVDANPIDNIRIIFDIAEEFDCDVDFHLDFLDDDKPLLAPVVIEETLRRGWQGRVCLGHMTKLAGLSPKDLEAIAKQLAEANISVLALPASDLYMMARQDSHNVRRGVAPVHILADYGVNVGLATNNVQNLFTPFGDGDVLKICTLLAQVLHLGTISQHQLCLDMATLKSAQAMGIQDYGLTVGHFADLVILGAETVSEAVGSAPIERTVLKKGRIVAQNKLERRLFAPV
ncbi:MAG: amidohydrolase family protein [Elainellaceae cyanobacterium]